MDRYFDVLIPKLVPLQCTQGGPIIAMQVENEYGSFGNDLRYLEHLKDALRKRGVDVLLFTSDDNSDLLLQGGIMPFIFKTVNFGSSPKEAFAKLKEYQPDKPLVCMEYWNGWYDQWGEEHRTRPLKRQLQFSMRCCSLALLSTFTCSTAALTSASITVLVVERSTCQL